MTVHLRQDTLPTAKENMDFDRNLLTQAISQPEDIFVRVYSWQNAGITLPEKRPVPSLLNSTDLSTRPTGGGIVFHSPKDLVLCLVLPLKMTQIPNPLKSKLHWVSEWIASAFKEQSIIAHRQATDISDKNLSFCKGYFSPSELYVGTEKVCGLTLRRYRHHVMIQGIIHLSNSQASFGHLDAFNGFFSNGIAINDAQLQKDLLNKFEQLIH